MARPYFPADSAQRHFSSQRHETVCQLTGLEGELPHTPILDLFHTHTHAHTRARSHTHNTLCSLGAEINITLTKHASPPC